jgi:calcineurin-like phosphoesterase family protein
MTVHFTADLHLDHENVLEMSGRLFRNIVEHNDCMIDIINRHVQENDRLYILGDVSWTAIDNYLARLKCKDVHLVWGNHDKQNFGKHFKSHQDVLEIKIGKKPNQIKVFLSHYAHAYWPASHHGAFHLYGHTHRQREETLDTAFPGRRSIDVGVDNALHILGEYRPFSEYDIVRILGARPGHDLPEFYEEFQAKLPKYRGAYVPESTPGATRRHEQQIAVIDEAKVPASAKEVAHKLNDFFLRNGNYGRVIHMGAPTEACPADPNDWVI